MELGEWIWGQIIENLDDRGSAVFYSLSHNILYSLSETHTTNPLELKM